MNIVKKPNLPQTNVKLSVIDDRAEEEIKIELNALGVKLITTTLPEELEAPICGHPDIHMLPLDGGSFIVSEYFIKKFNEELAKTTDCEKINNRQVVEKIKAGYPSDVPLNAVVLPKYVICNPLTVTRELVQEIDGKEIISVNQGYSKCSTLIVDDNAIITDDISIFNSAKKFLDVLYVEKGSVRLHGYNYGFIGGSGGKISKDTLAFFGNVKEHKFFNDIKSFCSNYSVDCISLSNGGLTDYGSLIPVLEK